MTRSILSLRIFHGVITLYFILCLFYIYYCAFTKQSSVILPIAVMSLLFEGVLLYIFNNGDCPLMHVQRKIGDTTPFFSLFFPKKIAKRAIPSFAVLTLLGLTFLFVRLFN